MRARPGAVGRRAARGRPRGRGRAPRGRGSPPGPSPSRARPTRPRGRSTRRPGSARRRRASDARARSWSRPARRSSPRRSARPPHAAPGASPAGAARRPTSRISTCLKLYCCSPSMIDLVSRTTRSRPSSAPSRPGMPSLSPAIALERAAPERLADDRGVEQQRPLRGRQRVEPRGDDPAHRRRERGVRGRGLGHRRRELLDEERVALGGLGQPRGVLAAQVLERAARRASASPRRSAAGSGSAV